MGMRCGPLLDHAGARREKKLSAGVRFSCDISGEKEGEWQCKYCDERKRDLRNCQNRRRFKHPILKGVDEWRSVSSTIRHIRKIGDIKFFECPISAIKPRTWNLMRLVNNATSSEHCDILHLVAPGTILDQPLWFTEAVHIVRSERMLHRQREMNK